MRVTLPPVPPEEMLTTAQVAALLGLGRNWTWRLIAAGRIPARKTTRGYRVRRSVAEAFASKPRPTGRPRVPKPWAGWGRTRDSSGTMEPRCYSAVANQIRERLLRAAETCGDRPLEPAS